MKLLSTFALVAALAGCGGKSTATTTPPPTTDVQAQVVLELGEIGLFEGETQIAKIHADGKTEITEGADKWGPGPTLKADGSVEHEGKVVVKVGSDGSMTEVASGQKLPFSVDSDKISITDEGKQMTIELAADGVLTFVGEKAPEKTLKVSGATTPGQRKTALAFFVIMVAGREGPAPDPKTSEPAPPPATP